MSFKFASVGHFFASVANDVVKAGKFAASALQKVNAEAPVIEQITGLVAPQAADIERGAFAIFGQAMQAVEAAGEAAGQNGLSVPLDATTVADLKTLLPALKQFANANGITKP